MRQGFTLLETTIATSVMALVVVAGIVAIIVSSTR